MANVSKTSKEKKSIESNQEATSQPPKEKSASPLKKKETISPNKKQAPKKANSMALNMGKAMANKIQNMVPKKGSSVNIIKKQVKSSKKSTIAEGTGLTMESNISEESLSEDIISAEEEKAI